MPAFIGSRCIVLVFFHCSFFIPWTIIKNVHTAQSTSRMWGCSLRWMQHSFSLTNVCQMWLKCWKNMTPPTVTTCITPGRGHVLWLTRAVGWWEKACKRCWNSIFPNPSERILVIWFVVFWSWFIFWLVQIADKPSDKVVFLVPFLVKQFSSLLRICSDLL